MHAEWSACRGTLVSGESAAEQPWEPLAAEATTLAYRVAWSVVRDRAEAEEIAQEALLRAHRHWPRLRNRERIRAWLVRVAWRLALDRQRAERRRERREQAAWALGPGAAGRTQSREFHFSLAREIERLPRKLRTTLLLAAVEGYNMGELARTLGVPEGTVKSRLFEARKRLVEKLQWIADDTKRT
ncbi:MAG TPA: RNA polymerase sigma factor [Candidatus Acidoferrales bacterium]|nr:RNA polymerase sigma factor [Candidatus Acidoferrales bacterium]